MITRYERFRQRALAELTSFRVDGRDAHLEDVARIFPPPHPVSTEIRARVRYVIDGWLDPGVLPDLRGMRERNPEFRFTFRRYERTDVGAGSRYGFRIDAIARRSVATAEKQPFFRAVFVDRSGKERVVPTSNEMAAHVLARCDPRRPKAKLMRHHGYIDEIRASLRPRGREQRLWATRLVTEHPEDLLAFADSTYGEPWREAFTCSLSLLPARDRWADRYRLISSGLTGGFTSDLTALSVHRPRPDVPDPCPALPVLRPERRGGVVEFVRTSDPMAAPDTRWLTVDGAQVQDGGTVTTGARLVNYETAADPSLTFVAGNWETSFGSMSHPEGMLLDRRPPAEAAIPEGILLSGRNDDNWYHWLAEYLPRALTVPADIAPDVPLLVSQRTPPTGLEAIREVSERPIAFIDPKRSQSVGRLHVAAPVVQILDSGHADWSSAATIDRRPLDALRARLGVDVPRDGEGRRIFLSRRSAHRAIRNEARLAEIATQSGLELVDPGGLTFPEQRELFSSAELVVGASGAVMANYLLMRPGSAIIALTSEQLHDFALPAVLATVARCSFRYVLGTSDIRVDEISDPNHWIHADFTIDETSFAESLQTAVPASSSGK